MQLHGLRWLRLLNGRPDCVWLVGHRSACGRRLSLRPTGPTPARSVTWPAPLQLRYVVVWGAIQECCMLWPLPFGSPCVKNVRIDFIAKGVYRDCVKCIAQKLLSLDLLGV